MDYDQELLLPYAQMCRLNCTIDDIKILKRITQHDIFIVFKDGDKYIFDTFANGFRWLKYKDANLTEQEWNFEFRQRLKDLMARKYITQEDIAKKLNTNQQTISRYINGESIPNAYRMNQLMNILNCGVKDLWFIPLLLKRYFEEEEV